MFEAGPNFTVLNLHVPCDLSAGRLPSVNLCCLPATEGNWSEWPAPNHHDQTQHDSGQAFSYHLTGLGITTPWTLGVSYRRIRHHETSGVNYFKLAKAAIYLGMKGLHQLGTNCSLPGDFLTIYTCDIDGSVDTVKGWHKFHMLDRYPRKSLPTHSQVTQNGTRMFTVEIIVIFFLVRFDTL